MSFSILKEQNSQLSEGWCFLFCCHSLTLAFFMFFKLCEAHNGPLKILSPGSSCSWLLPVIQVFIFYWNIAILVLPINLCHLSMSHFLYKICQWHTENHILFAICVHMLCVFLLQNNSLPGLFITEISDSSSQCMLHKQL